MTDNRALLSSNLVGKFRLTPESVKDLVVSALGERGHVVDSDAMNIEFEVIEFNYEVTEFTNTAAGRVQAAKQQPTPPNQQALLNQAEQLRTPAAVAT